MVLANGAGGNLATDDLYAAVHTGDPDAHIHSGATIYQYAATH